ncbi:MAG TPA: hypothetical protein VMW43_06950 [Bacteroidota bacterium]|nr:hypothetical protein [Bacteroidota bacterium]
MTRGIFGRPEVEEYLGAVERYSGRRFHFRTEIALLMELAAQTERSEEFEKIIFTAKFITRAFDILRRSGSGSEESKHLSAELQANLVSVTGLIRSLCSTDPTIADALFGERMFSLTHESLDLLKDLLSELTWIKNYSLDGHPPPLKAAR